MILIRHNNEGNLKPYFYFALEEYAYKHLLKDDETFFFTWEIKGVVIGKNQLIENEVNIDFLKNNNISLFRRPTGGGCVYADHRNTMFSIVAKRGKGTFSFKEYLQKIIDSFELLNIEVVFSGRNDLLFAGKKISGNAFLQNKYGMVMHGTLLYDVDIETMVRAITPSDEKLVSKGIESVRSRVVNLKPYLGGITQEQLIKHLENTLTNKTYTLSPKEIEIINEMAQKYSDKEFIYKKQPPHTKILKKRMSGGLFEIVLDLAEGIIRKLSLHGDFFDLKNLKEFEDLFINKPYESYIIKDILTNNPIFNYILDAKNDEFIELLESGIINL